MSWPGAIEIEKGFPTTLVSPFSISIAPGQLIHIDGRNLGPAAKVNAQLDATGRLSFIVSNTTVFFDNIAAPIISIQSSSIVCFVPFEASLTPQITVSSNGQRSNAVRIGVSPSAPQILTIANADGTPNSADHPARAGAAVALYVSGLGETSPLSVDRLVDTAPLPLPLASFTLHLSPASPFSPQAVVAAPGLIVAITQL